MGLRDFVTFWMSVIFHRITCEQGWSISSRSGGFTRIIYKRFLFEGLAPGCAARSGAGKCAPGVSWGCIPLDLDRMLYHGSSLLALFFSFFPLSGVLAHLFARTGKQYAWSRRCFTCVLGKISWLIVYWSLYSLAIHDSERHMCAK